MGESFRVALGESLNLFDFLLFLSSLKMVPTITEFPLLIKDAFSFTFRHSWNQETSYSQWVYLMGLRCFVFVPNTDQ